MTCVTTTVKRCAFLLVAVGVLAVLVAVDLLYAVEAKASPYGRREQLALARVCVSETGWDATPECAAIHEVLADRARVIGVSYMAALCSYSSKTCDRGRSDRRRWIAWLSPSLERPRGFPSHLRWASYRERWREMLRHAGAVLRGEVSSTCEEPPHYWGMPSGIDLRRAMLAGWRRIECPGARNAFWRVPHRSQPSS